MRDLQACISILEQNSRILRVKSEVDMRYEMSGIAKKLEGGETLLFEHPQGFSFPLLIGLMWSRVNLGIIFGVNARDLPFLIGNAFAEWLKRPDDPDLEPIVVPHAKAQEVLLDPLDITTLPTPVYALDDGGAYLSSCVVIAKDPETGVRNASIHRLMIAGPDKLGILMDQGRHLRHYYERAEKMGCPLEITINNGVDPSVIIAALSPASAAPLDRDELGIASVLLGEPLHLCKSKTVAPEGVADAQFILEGEILPNVREPEGPFAEVAGYYGTKADRWVVHLKAATRRAKPIIHALLPGIEVYNCVGLTAEATIFNTISKQVPGVCNVHMTHSSGFYTAAIQMDPKVPGMGKQAILAAFAAFPPLQVVTAVNSDVDIFNERDVQWALATRFNPDKDLIVINNASGHELNPMVENGLVNKIGFDCTCPTPLPERFKRVAFLDVNLEKYTFEKNPNCESI